MDFLKTGYKSTIFFAFMQIMNVFFSVFCKKCMLNLTKTPVILLLVLLLFGTFQKKV